MILSTTRLEKYSLPRGPTLGLASPRAIHTPHFLRGMAETCTSAPQPVVRGAWGAVGTGLENADGFRLGRKAEEVDARERS